MEFTDSEVVLGKMGSPDSPNVSDGISIPFVTIAALTHAPTQSLPQQACVATSFSIPMACLQPESLPLLPLAFT